MGLDGSGLLLVAVILSAEHVKNSADPDFLLKKLIEVTGVDKIVRFEHSQVDATFALAVECKTPIMHSEEHLPPAQNFLPFCMSVGCWTGSDHLPILEAVSRMATRILWDVTPAA
jgi:hypothetical protein